MVTVSWYLTFIWWSPIVSGRLLSLDDDPDESAIITSYNYGTVNVASVCVEFRAAYTKSYAFRNYA